MIAFFIGPSSSGKTYARKRMFPDAEYIDIYDYQQMYLNDYHGPLIAQLAKAEEAAIDDFVHMVRYKKEGEVICYENILSNKRRRKDYVARVRAALEASGMNEDIICFIVVLQDEDIFEKNRLQMIDRQKTENATISDSTVKWRSEGLRVQRDAFKNIDIDGDGFDAVFTLNTVMLH